MAPPLRLVTEADTASPDSQDNTPARRYGSPFIGRYDSTGLLAGWRDRTAQVLRSKVRRSDLVAEVITLELMPLYGDRAPQLGEGNPAAAVKVFRLAVRWLVGMGLSPTRIRVLLEDTLREDTTPPPPLRAG